MDKKLISSLEGYSCYPKKYAKVCDNVILNQAINELYKEYPELIELFKKIDSLIEDRIYVMKWKVSSNKNILICCEIKTDICFNIILNKDFEYNNFVLRVAFNEVLFENENFLP